MQTNESIERMLSYFRPHPSIFWRWGDGGRVIEHRDGTTICYREEIERCMEMFKWGAPELTPIILLIAASRDNFAQSPLQTKEWISTEGSGALAMSEFATLLSQDALGFLNRVNQLPPALRSSTRLPYLIKIVLEQEEEYYDNAYEELTAAFKRGELDSGLAQPLPDKQHLGGQFEALYHGIQKFPTLASLQNTLETGLPEPPQAAELPIPEVQQPDENASPLLEELLQDPRTCGIAHLTHHLVAVFNIPMQAHGSSDLPLGGISDITNRGNYDRLLLSELANDDLTLMARLSNNEALFLRREEPPVKIEKERVVLFDTTIKLWGMTRAFAISAALACRERNLPGNAFSAYALGGNRFAPADLGTKVGVNAALGLLDASLHAADGLAKCLQALPKGDHELILVTAAELLGDPAFNTALIALQPKLDYLVTVARDGHLQLFELKHDHRRLLSEGRFDLNDLLLRKPQNRPLAVDYDALELPAFYKENPSPLYFPATSNRLRANNTKICGHNSILVVTDNNRLLLWRGERTAAIEVAPYVSANSSVKLHLFGGGNVVVIAPRNEPQQLRANIFDVTNNSSWSVDLNTEHWQNVYFNQPFLFYFKPTGSIHSREFRRVNFVTGEDILSPDEYGKLSDCVVGAVQAGNYSLHDLKKVVNPGYSTLQQVKYVGIDVDGRLTLDGRSLEATVHEEFLLNARRAMTNGLVARVEGTGEGLATPHNPSIKLRRMQWKDGSVGFLDPRGFLHLRSSDPSLPEITIVLIVDQPTAAWASTGIFSGASYFTNNNSKIQRIPPSEFNRLYLQPFVHRILNMP